MQTLHLRKDWAVPHGHEPDASQPNASAQRLALVAMASAGAILMTLVIAGGHRPANESDLLTRMAEQGNTGAELQLGLDYRDGRDGVARSPKASLKWLTRAAEGGSAYAADALGNAYAEGRGTTPSTAEAEHWWLTAARAGNADAQRRLGEQLAREDRAEEALPWLEKASAQGLEEARTALDQVLRESGDPQHRGTAAEPPAPGALDVLAARLHSPTFGATALVGHLIGRAGTEPQSLERLRAHAERGDHLAQYQLGMRYLSGAWGQRRDPDQAAVWLTRAARGGNQLASQALARMDGAEVLQGASGAAPIRTAAVVEPERIISH